MTYNEPQRHRRSIRLQGYDFTQAGAYCITIGTHGRACVFGDVVDATMRLNKCAAILRVSPYGRPAGPRYRNRTNHDPRRTPTSPIPTSCPFSVPH
jgi:hypothetical protein